MSKTPKMLLVDDEPGVVWPLSAVIDLAFWERVDLTALTDSVAAKSWVDRHAPEMIVTDLQMPRVNGLDILKTAKRKNPDCQVVIYSGYHSAEITHLAKRLGATGYLSKSTDPQCLLDLLEQAHCRVIAQAKEPSGGAPIASLPFIPALSRP